MKRSFFILILGVIFYYQAEARKVHGYYLTKSLDTMKVSFEIPTGSFSGKPKYERMQAGIEYYDNAGMVQVLLSTHACEVSFEYSGQRIRMVSSEGNLGMYEGVFIVYEATFLHLIKDGKLRLFKYYTREKKRINMVLPIQSVGPGAPMAMVGIPGKVTVKYEDYIFQKDTADFFQTKDKSTIFKKDTFEQDMMDYLSDCPYVAKKTKFHQYTRDDIELMVEEYNKFCGNQKQGETK
jgi:hypothetical protein